jgi:hypothetical protein
MNIFVLHPNPRKAARWHADKHVIKMLLETCQLLYTVHWVLAYPELKNCSTPVALSRLQKTLALPRTMETAPMNSTGTQRGYRPCHTRHPCARWARQTSGNYHWLAQLGLHLAEEYHYRFGKHHACEAHIHWLVVHRPRTLKPYPRRPFAIAMAEEYRVSPNPIISYRHYYRTSKAERGLLHYTKRHSPHWIDVSALS